MAREYSRMQEIFLQLHELQPPTPLYHHNHPYEIAQANPSAPQTYKLTSIDMLGPVDAGTGAGVQAPSALEAPHPPHQVPEPSHANHQEHRHNHHHESSKRMTHYSSESYDMSSCDGSLSAPQLSVPASATRKRKPSSYGTGSVYDDDGCDDAKSTRTLSDKKQNHSEIEKRRRDKMNTYISELSSMIPTCGSMARKLDKLTVLRMAVQHLRSIRSALSACPLTSKPRPTFLSERELNALILHAAQDCFLIVVGCNRGKLLYASASVKKVLHYDQSELLGQSLFDIIHPKDVAKVKEQLTSSDLTPREKLIDLKTMLPVKANVASGASRFCTGARRSFFCSIKRKTLPGAAAAPATDTAPTPPQEPPTTPVKKEGETTSKQRKKQNEKKYCIVQCTGYLKSWAPADLGGAPVDLASGAPATSTSDGGDDWDACNMTCLVAVGRALPDLSPPANYHSPSRPPTRHLQFVSRHSIDGKFLFVDQRVTPALGFLPQELLGTNLYVYINGPEVGAVAHTHKASLLQKNAMFTPPYSFRKKDGTYVNMQTHFKPFRNPWSKDVECLVANNTIVSESHIPPQGDGSQQSYDVYKQMDLEMQQLIASQVESDKIGSTIAKEVLRRSSSEFSPDIPEDLLQDAMFNHQISLDDNIFGMDIVNFTPVRNNVPLSAAGAQSSPSLDNVVNLGTGGTPPSASPPFTSLGIDGNGEATMAVIMSLLEANARLGGPVNLAELP